MKSASSNLTSIWSQRSWAIPLAGVALAAAGNAQQFSAGEKGKVKGEIISRTGDQVKVQDTKTGSLVTVVIADDTKVLRAKSKVVFRRHEDMDVTAMVPGLTIKAEGVGNSSGQLEASKITFSPDVFAIQVAQEQGVAGL